jgi:hypothetical protein
LLLDFAYACGSPLNENYQYTIKSTSPTMVVAVVAGSGGRQWWQAVGKVPVGGATSVRYTRRSADGIPLFRGLT